MVNLTGRIDITYYMKKNFLLAFLCCFLLSCKKQFVVCTANCYSLPVDGKVVNSLTNANVPGVPLEISRVKFVGLASGSGTVQEFSTKADGNFSISPRVDTTMFQNGYFLSLRMRPNDNYITVPSFDYRLYDLSVNTFSNMTLYVYPKVNLTIRLNRVQNDNFRYFSVDYYFVQNEVFPAYAALSPNDLNKTQLVVPTSADLYTKIKVIKTDQAGVSTMTVDSIRCLMNTANVYTVNF